MFTQRFVGGIAAANCTWHQAPKIVIYNQLLLLCVTINKQNDLFELLSELYSCWAESIIMEVYDDQQGRR